MSWMHGLDQNPGEWAALQRRHETQAAALDDFLNLMLGLQTRFQAITADLATLAETVGSLRAARVAGARRPRDGMAVTGSSIWFVRLPLALFLGHGLLGRAEGVWISMLVSQAVQAVLCLCVYQFARWTRFAMGRAAQQRT